MLRISFISSLFLSALTAMLLVLTCSSVACASMQAKNNGKRYYRYSPPRITWTNQPLRAMPVAMNNLGAVNLVGPQRPIEYGFAGIGPITFAPFNANMQNSSMLFNGTAVRVEEVSWTPCEGTRKSNLVKLSHGIVDVQNQVRMPFGRRSVVQRWTITSEHPIVINAMFDGPWARMCDDAGIAQSPSCGWGTNVPIDRGNFSKRIDSGLMLSKDRFTGASSAASFWSQCGNKTSLSNVRIDDDSGMFAASLSLDPGCVLFHAIGVGGKDEATASSIVRDVMKDSSNVFQNACQDFNEHIQSAFDPHSNFFSGTLPTLESPDFPSMEKLYDWAASALVSLERDGWPSTKRAFVISEGPSNSFDGSADMGGSGQFIWDLSFAGTSYALLEPDGTRAIIGHMVKNADFSAVPFQTIQAWDGYLKYPNVVGPGEYCFDFVASFLYIETYVRTTGDVSLLASTFRNNHDHQQYSVLDFLRKLAWAWTGYAKSAQSPYLVDYGGNKRSFLEAVSTYTNVIPGLQGANAAMMFSLASLLEGSDMEDSAEVANLKGNASHIVHDMIKFQFVKDGSWNVLYANSKKQTNVRALADFVYIGLGLGGYIKGGGKPVLPEHVRDQMRSMFKREFLANGWVRAMSLEDSTQKNIMCTKSCTVEDKVAMRADWTASGVGIYCFSFALFILTFSSSLSARHMAAYQAIASTLLPISSSVWEMLLLRFEISLLSLTKQKTGERCHLRAWQL